MATSSTPDHNSSAPLRELDLSNITQNESLSLDNKFEKIYAELVDMKKDKEEIMKILVELKNDRVKKSRKRIEVPLGCSAAVRSIYKAIVKRGEEEQENAEQGDSGCQKWDFNESYGFAYNQDVTKNIVGEIMAAFPSKWTREEIEEACKVHWKSLQNKNTRGKTPGKVENHRSMVKRNQIVKRKLERRKKVCESMGWNGTKKQKVKDILTKEYMSSEESDPEDNKKRIVKTLLWESEKLKKYKAELDKKDLETASSGSIRLRLATHRQEECTSFRRAPANAPSWAIDGHGVS